MSFNPIRSSKINLLSTKKQRRKHKKGVRVCVLSLAKRTARCLSLHTPQHPLDNIITWLWEKCTHKFHWNKHRHNEKTVKTGKQIPLLSLSLYSLSVHAEYSSTVQAMAERWEKPTSCSDAIHLHAPSSHGLNGEKQYCRPQRSRLPTTQHPH